MKLFVGCLPAASACVEVDPMSRTCARFVSMVTITASAVANDHARALNNNGNNNSRVHGWAGV
jgi:hypothetical protein